MERGTLSLVWIGHEEEQNSGGDRGAAVVPLDRGVQGIDDAAYESGSHSHYRTAGRSHCQRRQVHSESRFGEY